jgi:hypothetical protein
MIYFLPIEKVKRTHSNVKLITSSQVNVLELFIQECLQENGVEKLQKDLHALKD